MTHQFIILTKSQEIEEMNIKKFFIAIRNIIILFKIFQYYSFKNIFKGTVLLKDRPISHKLWAVQIFSYMKCKLHEFEGQPMRQQKTMFLVNHRSQGDFFIHNIVLNFKVNFLSRWLVGIVFPAFGLFAYDSVWFFNRNGSVNVDKFNQWLDQKFEKSPRPSLLAYPEGHRMPGTISCDRSKLKTGMIRYAYRRRIPVQFCMTFGNQHVLNEKKLHLSWGETIYYKISEVHDPINFEEEDEFVNKMKDRFCEFFDEVYDLYKQQKKIDNEK